MEHSSFGVANNHSISPEILRLVWNRNFHYRVRSVRHWSVLWARWIGSKTLRCYLTKINSSITLTSTSRSYGWSLPFKCATDIMYEFLISPMRGKWPVNSTALILNLTKFGENYKLWTSSLFCLLLPPAVSHCYA